MPTLDLALGLRMVRCAADMSHTLVDEPILEVAGDAQDEPLSLSNLGLWTQRPPCRLADACRASFRVSVTSSAPHGRAQLPRDDVAGVVVVDRYNQPQPTTLR